MQLSKAIFLDRDGVLNTELGTFVTTIDELTFIDGTPQALVKLKEQGYVFVVITNQSGIAQGLYTIETLNQIHQKLVYYYAKWGIAFLAIYFCPHHPNYSKCLCRKPGSLNIEKAMARFNIDPTQSYFIGDRDRDVEAALAAGVKPILVEANTDLNNYLHLIE